MRSAPIRVIVFLSCVLGLAMATTATGFAAERCAAESEAALAELGVDSTDVSSLTVRRRIQSNRSRSRVTGFEAWVRLRSCEGALVIEFTRDCRQRQAYTRGECQISGLSAY